MIEEVILVNEEDQEIGSAEKLEAHKKGLLHRAFSVLIFNSAGEMLIQQRALTKYHSPGLWSNACCSHPRPGEKIEDAVTRRLKEELGMTCSLRYLSKFQYQVEFENGLTEHEMDYVFAGESDQEPSLNPKEISNLRYISMEDLHLEISRSPERFTEWFKMIINNLKL